MRNCNQCLRTRIWKLKKNFVASLARKAIHFENQLQQTHDAIETPVKGKECEIHQVIETKLPVCMSGFQAQIANASKSLQEQVGEHSSNLETQARVVVNDIDLFANLNSNLQNLDQEKLDATIQEEVLAQVEKNSKRNLDRAHTKSGRNNG